MVLEDKAFLKPTLQSFITAGDANRDMNEYPLSSAFPLASSFGTLNIKRWCMAGFILNAPHVSLG